MFCVVERDLNAHLKRYDDFQARSEWLGMQAQDDGYSHYIDDAFEKAELNDVDAEIAADTGELSLISKEGQELVTDLAFELAAKDGFSRYDE